MSRLTHDVTVTISYGDVYATKTLPKGLDMPNGLRRALITTTDRLAEQLNLPVPTGMSAADRALVEKIATALPNVSVADKSATTQNKES